ncbi:hypothetical protein TI39_contig430g00003 [Zymoseptoria brevis]|uniref:Uncharacterized protein n=1 Tax=Zymoseptoria brevis TaxID=1047168 RepID=A0A0F4GPL5_9PEZI|nr:hypothetical protein TI39_contig430g00003 [Zymoseptoria brevis]
MQDLQPDMDKQSYEQALDDFLYQQNQNSTVDDQAYRQHSMSKHELLFAMSKHNSVAHLSHIPHKNSTRLLHNAATIHEDPEHYERPSDIEDYTIELDFNSDAPCIEEQIFYAIEASGEAKEPEIHLTSVDKAVKEVRQSLELLDMQSYERLTQLQAVMFAKATKRLREGAPPYPDTIFCAQRGDDDDNDDEENEFSDAEAENHYVKYLEERLALLDRKAKDRQAHAGHKNDALPGQNWPRSVPLPGEVDGQDRMDLV